MQFRIFRGPLGATLCQFLQVNIDAVFFKLVNDTLVFRNDYHNTWQTSSPLI